jgi:hypothetical protein
MAFGFEKCSDNLLTKQNIHLQMIILCSENRIETEKM